MFFFFFGGGGRVGGGFRVWGLGWFVVLQGVSRASLQGFVCICKGFWAVYLGGLGFTV